MCWAFVPEPPVLQPVTWAGKSVPVLVNDTRVLGGRAGALKHSPIMEIIITLDGPLTLLCESP